MNDVAVQGVRPIGFALYISGNAFWDRLIEIENKAEVVAARYGLKKFPSMMAIKQDVYMPNEVDIAATVVGIIDQRDIITGSRVQPGNCIIGIGTDGYMTNGCSMVRRFASGLLAQGIIASYDEPMKDLEGRTLDYEMRRPHRPMVDILFGDARAEGVLSKYDILGMAHITGGAQPDNIIRMVPDNLKAVVKREVLPVPPLMQLMRQYGVKDDELWNTFNMGVMFTMTVDSNHAQPIVDYVNDTFRYRVDGVDRKAAIIGRIEQRNQLEPKFQWQ
jgi:phosphoribosylformylglycinamidine cyclo-ligase